MQRLFLIAALVLSGCSTSFQTRPFDAVKDSGAIAGIIYYEPRLTKVTYVYTVLADKDGNVKGSAAEKTCRETLQKEEIQVLPDYAHPRVFLNTSSPLSTGKVGVSLDRGMLTAVNVENTPPVAGVAAPVGTVAAAAVTKLAATPDVLPICNAGPAITAVSAL